MRALMNEKLPLTRDLAPGLQSVSGIKVAGIHPFVLAFLRRVYRPLCCLGIDEVRFARNRPLL